MQGREAECYGLYEGFIKEYDATPVNGLFSVTTNEVPACRQNGSYLIRYP